MSQTEPQSISHTEQVLNEIQEMLFSLPHDSGSNHAVLIRHYLDRWERWNNSPRSGIPYLGGGPSPTIFTPVSGPPNQVSMGHVP